MHACMHFGRTFLPSTFVLPVMIFLMWMLVFFLLIGGATEHLVFIVALKKIVTRPDMCAVLPQNSTGLKGSNLGRKTDR